MSGNHTLFHRAKSIEKKKYSGMTNIDAINWEKLFDRSSEHK